MIGTLLLVAALPGADPGSLAEKVSRPRLERDLLTLQSAGADESGLPGTRVTGTGGSERARAFLAAELARAGLLVERESFFVAHAFEPELRARDENLWVRFGPERAPRLAVIAHLDSRGAQDREDARRSAWVWSTGPSPGADDNASGSAALLELARLLAESSWQPDIRVDLVWTGAEEMAKVGPDGFMFDIGADALAARYDAESASVVGALSVDMLLRSRHFGPSFRVYSDGRFDSQRIAEALELAAAMLEPVAELRTVVDPAFIWSDHGSFWAFGWPGVLFIEDDFHHERYHRPSDRYDAGDPFYSLDHLVRGTRILLGAVLLLGRG